MARTCRLRLDEGAGSSSCGNFPSHGQENRAEFYTSQVSVSHTHTQCLLSHVTFLKIEHWKGVWGQPPLAAHPLHACNPAMCPPPVPQPQMQHEKQPCCSMHMQPLSVTMSSSQRRQLQRRLDVRADTSLFTARPLLLWAFQCSCKPSSARAHLSFVSLPHKIAHSAAIWGPNSGRVVRCNRLLPALSATPADTLSVSSASTAQPHTRVSAHCCRSKQTPAAHAAAMGVDQGARAHVDCLRVRWFVNAHRYAEHV